MRQLMFGTLAGLMLLSGVLLWLNCIAQVPKQAQIAFCSDRDGDFEIYTMESNGGHLRKLTTILHGMGIQNGLPVVR